MQDTTLNQTDITTSEETKGKGCEKDLSNDVDLNENESFDVDNIGVELGEPITDASKRKREYTYTQQLDRIIQKFGSVDNFKDYLLKNICTNPYDEFSIIIHNQDISAKDGQSIVVPHVHVVFKFKNAKIPSTLAKLLKEFKNDGVTPNLQWLKYISGKYGYENSLSYLVHRTKKAKEAGKYQYSPDDVIANFDYKKRLADIEADVNKAALKDIKAKHDKEKINKVLTAIAEGSITLEQAINTLGIPVYIKIEKYITGALKLQNKQMVDKTRERLKKQGKPIKVIWIFGESRKGKTQLARHLAKQCGDGNYYFAASSRGMYEQYKGESIGILDELRPDTVGEYADFLKLTDEYSYLDEVYMPSRYYDKLVCFEVIIITSPMSPKQFYDLMGLNHRDSFAQLENRLTMVLETTDDYYQSVRYDYNCQCYIPDGTEPIVNLFSKAKNMEYDTEKRERKENIMEKIRMIPTYEEYYEELEERNSLLVGADFEIEDDIEIEDDRDFYRDKLDDFIENFNEDIIYTDFSEEYIYTYNLISDYIIQRRIRCGYKIEISPEKQKEFSDYENMLLDEAKELMLKVSSKYQGILNLFDVKETEETEKTEKTEETEETEKTEKTEKTEETEKTE